MSDQPHQELADALSGIMTVVESHATVAGFWMGEHAKARLLADDLQSEIYMLQEQIEELRKRDESEELKALQAKLDVSQKELRASKKANHELVHTEVLMTQQIGVLKTKVSDERERYSALNQSLADQKAKIESDLETSQARITEMETEIAAAKNAATIMSEKVSAPGQETAGDQGWMSIQNALLKENIRKIGTHLDRVDDQFTENPDRALRSLDLAKKLVLKSADIGGKSS
ncbi:hypothetical protein [Corynebacterium glutamicum]|uniref:hypothetical protein n=1 Tax=Corynebacterium glutamicum TaxID=1718 RepID=UPI0009458E1E|nr:hypothetical protein [Corynebacterium glutamicum]OKX85156.1 hypothetical protein AUO95_01070 [Corynebacterium glutamicum]